MRKITGAQALDPRLKSNKSATGKYHCYDSCNKCGGVNESITTDSLDYQMLECKTKCRDCGFEDYWAHGFFESSQNMVGKCNTYGYK